MHLIKNIRGEFLHRFKKARRSYATENYLKILSQITTHASFSEKVKGSRGPLLLKADNKYFTLKFRFRF